MSASEEGNVVITAILVMAIMLSVGMAILSRADGQTAQSRIEREGESTFNLSEGALTQQIFILGRRGPGTSSTPYPPSCGAGTDSEGFCPDSTRLARNYDQATQKDFDPAEVEWRTWVRDNANGSGVPDTFWTDSLLGDPVTGTGGRPRYDANGDKLMWVRAQAQVQGRERAIVGLVRIEPRTVPLPENTILAGTFKTTNNGKHSNQIVDTTGSHGVTVRCGPPGGEAPVSNCLEYEASKGQITPNLVHTGSTEGDALSEDDLDALLDVAKANDTYNVGEQPASLTGAVVVLDPGGSTTWKWTGNDTFNSPSKPGMVILLSGKLELTGTVNFYGLVYHANLSNSTDTDLVKVHGNSQLQGGVIVDGEGGVEAGSSGKLNVKFDPNAFANVNAFGTAGVVQNTWREIKPLALQ